ncbi:MAG: alpha/beta hydrolase-fold protein [Acidobacteriota bacterium]
MFAALSAAVFAQKPAESSKPFILGTIEEIQSAELGEKRTLNIYLPAGYDSKSTVKYPVVYLLDGSADEDFIHIVGLYQFNNFEWIDRVPKSIVVGIATVDRQRDLTFASSVEAEKKRFPNAGHSDKFAAFIEKELQPFIVKKFNASNDRTIIGQSLGGLFATEILLTKPTLFNRYIIVSPSLWWNNGSLLSLPVAALQNAALQKTDVYIGVGKEGLTPGNPPRVMEVDANLLAEKINAAKNKNMTVKFDYLPQEDHATILHQAVFNAMRLLYPQPGH